MCSWMARPFRRSRACWRRSRLLAVVRAPLLVVGDLLAQRAADRLKRRLRADLTRHLLALGPVYTGRERSGELAAVVVNGTDTLDAWVTVFEPARTLAVAVPLLVLAAIAAVDPPTVLVLLLTGPVLVLLLAFIGGRARVDHRASLRRASLAQRLLPRHAPGAPDPQALRAERRAGRHRSATSAAATATRRWRSCGPRSRRRSCSNGAARSPSRSSRSRSACD